MGDGASLRLLANLSDQITAHKQSQLSDTGIWGGDAGDTIAPWSVFWHIGAR
jgi:maltooligosyltrehalose trehalohydrolase